MRLKTRSSALLTLLGGAIAVAASFGAGFGPVRTGRGAVRPACRCWWLCSLLGWQPWPGVRGPYRRVFLVLLFLTAAFDVSKAIVPPLELYYSPGLYLTLSHVMLLCLSLTWIVEHVYFQGRALPRTRLDVLALVFLVWVWVSSLSGPGSLSLRVASAVTYSPLRAGLLRGVAFDSRFARYQSAAAGRGARTDLSGHACGRADAHPQLFAFARFQGLPRCRRFV